MPSYPLIHKQISPLPRTPSPFAAASVTLLLHCQGGSKTDRRFGSLSDRRAQQMMFRIVAEILNSGKSPQDINAVIPLKKSNLFAGFDGELDSSGFIERVKAEKSDQAAKWYFARDDELFRYGGKTYALTNQWGKNTVERALESLKQTYPEIGINYEPGEQNG